MNLIENWKDVAKKSWSFWLSIVTGLLAAAEMVLPLFVDSIQRGWFVALAAGAAVLSAVARLVYQKSLNAKE